MHVVSDQLSRHKGRGGWDSARGSDSLPGTSRPLCPPSSRLCRMCPSGPMRKRWGCWVRGGGQIGGGNFVQHRAEDVKQSAQQTRPSLDLSSPQFSANTHTHTCTPAHSTDYCENSRRHSFTHNHQPQKAISFFCSVVIITAPDSILQTCNLLRLSWSSAASKHQDF